MIVHAHDDESSQTGGTLARYSAEGYRTVLVTSTDGRHGDAAGLDPSLVPARRSGELDLAAKALGISDVVKLAYPDSGLSEHPVHIRTHDVVVAAHRHIVANAETGAGAEALLHCDLRHECADHAGPGPGVARRRGR